MHTTSVTLLERLRLPGEQEAWNRFVELYTPLIYYWARRVGLHEPDASDLVQEVLTAMVQKLPEFIYDERKSFRSWLRTVTLNKWHDGQRRRGAALPMTGNTALSRVAGKDDAEKFWEAEYQQHLVGRALQLMKAEFQPTTWKACWETVVSEKPAAEVAAELGITIGAVYAAKSRVLRRLRQELQGLLE